MYFVTMGGISGYVWFSTTPRGRAAIGLTETGNVRVLAPGENTRDWRVLREWPASVYSHTELLVALGRAEEPETAEELLAALPAETLV
ncbi:MAG TPA: hypothetical protein VIS07_18640 [Candidatus Binatia bacterium]